VSFAEDAQTRAYYDRRAAEYDDWWNGTGLYARRERPGWPEETARVVELVASLPAARTLDVACGTGFLTRHLRGAVVALDQSPGMLRIVRARLGTGGGAVRGDALRLPFRDGAFTRVLTGHFYGHLPPPERERFLAEARRVAGALVVVDSAMRTGIEPEQWQERVLNDGSRHRVFKRYLAPEQLADEIGGEVLLRGRWFVAAAAAW
jgi:demethylmenaquinone methyltransferase/2-methoxy-6-polyprenyl-1,4-benzoquinol methylase